MRDALIVAGALWLVWKLARLKRQNRVTEVWMAEHRYDKSGY